MMRAWMIGSALASALLGACYGHGARNQDGQSHWLRQCMSGSACGDDEICACGVCTRLCKDDGSCGDGSQCTRVGEASSCRSAPAGIKQVCLARCDTRSDCAKGASALMCVDQVCVTPGAAEAGVHAPVSEPDAGDDAGDDGGPNGPKSADAGVLGGAGGSGPLEIMRPPPNFSSPRFIVLIPHVSGDLLSTETNVREPVYMTTCAPVTTLDKFSIDLERYVPPRDDRPPFYDNPGYYLDDAYVPPSHSLNCGAMVCAPFPDGNRLEFGESYEYVKIGSKAPPAGAPAERAQVDVVERRPLTGMLRLSVPFFDDDACSVASGASVEITIPPPEQGVCCPVGEAGCASEGPRGGWAITLEQCRPFVPSGEHAHVLRDDPRGCPVLIEDQSSCCGCGADADAGP